MSYLSCCVVFFFFLMIRRPPRSTLSSSSAASDVYKRQVRLRKELTSGGKTTWTEGDPVLRAGDNPGDWHCPKCSNLNWAKRNTCNVCKTSKSELLELAVREGSAGGFKERDEEEERKRRRRKEEAHQETKRRKQDKVRCKFCKRFSCIC
eukprot:TRINITY_DN60110_c0_g1_i1.p1 TRINITY_DN60110_c0_g1~~TRINITY_DN60110_c0_g1_i1.p1  ORF type:complete len:150 (+),score=45.81 TRINITY_DN60110_c0_g1_i1:103-552(+)